VKLKSLWPVGARRLVRLFRSLGTRWKHREEFRKFDAAVDRAIKTDARLHELNKARKRRINEIIIEAGKQS
jgi:hypothetical protein